MLFNTGLVTRNNTWDLSQDNKHRHKITDAIAVSSIISNCAGVESATDRCLGLAEVRLFLRDYQVYSFSQWLLAYCYGQVPDTIKLSNGGFG